MTTRYNMSRQSRSRFNQPPLPSGYDGKSAPEIAVPACGLEDVDRALFDLFDKEIPLTVSPDGAKGDAVKVPIVFYAGEKWALNKRLHGLKDRNNALILPLITGIRTSVVQSPAADITGRGINQQTGEIVIHRRLDKSDRNYQQLINRLLLPHQQNLAVNPGNQDVGQLTTLRDVGDLSDDGNVQQGALLIPDRGNNVYETIVVPSPQFFTAQYDITVWTQYTSHMNQIIEQLIASQLPQGNCWRLDSPKGYWFIASTVDNNYTADLNVEDFSQTERVIRYKFVIQVPGYILASNVPGAPVPIKRYVSSPAISFETVIDESGSDGGVQDPFLGADDPTLPLTPGDDLVMKERRDMRDVGNTRLYPHLDANNPQDPALRSLPRGTRPARFKKITGYDKSGRLVDRLYRVKNVNKSTGETVLSAADASLGGLSIVVTED